MITFIVMAILLPSIFHLFTKWMLKWGNYESTQNRIRQINDEINILSFDEARLLAEQALSNPIRFECRESTLTNQPQIDQLASGLKSFFERYERVVPDWGGVYIDRSLIEPSELMEGYLKIGDDSEHSELVIKPYEETIYVIPDDEPIDESTMDRYPSIFHYLLYINKMMVDF